MSDVTDLLARIPVFSNLAEPELLAIAQLIRVVRGEPGTVICREGQAAKAVFILSAGSVEVLKETEHGDSQVLAKLKPPTVIGEMALLDGAPRSATVAATTSVVLYRIEVDAFNELRRNFEPAAYKVLHNLALTLCDRLRDTNDKINAFFDDPEGSLRQMQARQKRLFDERQASRPGE